jgi:hypothetical protein
VDKCVDNLARGLIFHVRACKLSIFWTALNLSHRLSPLLAAKWKRLGLRAARFTEK